MHNLMVGKKEKTMESIKNLSYSKDKTSLLEIAVGITSGFIKRITLLLSKEYDICDRKAEICLCQLTSDEVNHIKNELNDQ